MPDCAVCGKAVPAGSRYCPECGSSLETVAAAPRRAWWTPDPLLLAAALAVFVAVLLLVVAEWAWGVVALLAAVVLLLARNHLDRRAAAHALAGLRVRAAATREAMALRSRAQVELFRARRELAELEADRNRLFRDLGEAVYTDDETGINAARTALQTVTERVAEKEVEIETLRRETEQRVQRVQAQARPTERMEAPPEPARVPEPWPPPDEGDLPEPPRPGPGEPVPGPDEPPPPARPPTPQTRGRDEA